FDGARVAELLGQWDLVPGKARRAHVDGELRILRRPAIDHARACLEGKIVLAGRGAEQGSDAAHAVAAGAGFGTVVVVDAHEGVGARRARCIERHQLVVVHALARARRARFLGRDRGRAGAQVDDDDLVADPVHLDERPVGERAHLFTCVLPAGPVARLSPGLYGESTAIGQWPCYTVRPAENGRCSRIMESFHVTRALGRTIARSPDARRRCRYGLRASGTRDEARRAGATRG